jgi:hypothetical protein
MDSSGTASSISRWKRASKGPLRAAHGFRVLGSSELAEVVTRAHAIAAQVADKVGEFDVLNATRGELDEIRALDQRYFDLLPSDEALERIFRDYLAAHPGDLEPL